MDSLQSLTVQYLSRYKYSLEAADNVTIGQTGEGMGMFGSLFGGGLFLSWGIHINVPI